MLHCYKNHTTDLENISCSFYLFKASVLIVRRHRHIRTNVNSQYFTLEPGVTLKQLILRQSVTRLTFVSLTEVKSRTYRVIHLWPRSPSRPPTKIKHFPCQTLTVLISKKQEIVFNLTTHMLKGT